jgi:MraZ protein
MFVGTGEAVVDDKARTIVPVKLRDQLPADKKNLAIVKWFNGCLAVFPVADLEEFAQRLKDDRFQGTEEGRLFRHMLLAGASVEKLDSQGRIPLSEQQLRHAGLERKQRVVIFGNLERIEIWSQERLDARFAQAGQDSHTLESLATTVFGSQG